MVRGVRAALCCGLILIGSVTAGLQMALAESRITALPSDGSERKGMSASARLRIVVEVPPRLSLDNTQGQARITTNSGTAVGQCAGGRGAAKSPECAMMGIGTSGINTWDAPRGMTAVAQP